MDLDLHVILSKAVDFATECAIGETEPSFQLFLAYPNQDEMHMYVHPPYYGEDVEAGKTSFADFLRAKFREDHILAYANISEVWVIDDNCRAMQEVKRVAKTIPEPSRAQFIEYAIKLMPPPSEHPDRREVVTVIVCSATDAVWRSFEIERESGIIEVGKIKALKEHRGMLAGKIGVDIKGRFATLLVP